MTNDPKDHVLAWLRDAHAAEEQAETMLSTMSGRLENYPELKARVDQHIGETQRQSEAMGHTKIENTVRYLGVDIEDALELAERTEI